MPRNIATFADGSILEFDQGGIDLWCVYVTRPGTIRTAPKDFHYFSQLQQFAAKYTSARIYSDFVQVYNATEYDINPQTLQLIEEISQDYDDGLEICFLFTLLYAVMLSEQNRANTRLGKRIKRLGIHQQLLEGFSIQNAANFSRGMGWREISNECTQRGF